MLEKIMIVAGTERGLCGDEMQSVSKAEMPQGSRRLVKEPGPLTLASAVSVEYEVEARLAGPGRVRRGGGVG